MTQNFLNKWEISLTISSLCNVTLNSTIIHLVSLEYEILTFTIMSTCWEVVYFPVNERALVLLIF